MTPAEQRYSVFKSTVAELSRALTLVLNEDPDRDMDAIRKLLDDAKTLVLETVIAEEQEAKAQIAQRAEEAIRMQKAKELERFKHEMLRIQMEREREKYSRTYKGG